ncbi:hypothetical protein SBV1_340043 [Verrucomicrobia bacterium]|nr:hypothetical protein SBV1_340043 [Verrucomicrobiota bacterium]
MPDDWFLYSASEYAINVPASATSLPFLADWLVRSPEASRAGRMLTPAFIGFSRSLAIR